MKTEILYDLETKNYNLKKGIKKIPLKYKTIDKTRRFRENELKREILKNEK